MSGRAGYSAAHARVKAARGKAQEHPCVDCGAQAQEWSYDHADDSELLEVIHGRELPYSLSPSHYDPRCTSCHQRFDRPVFVAGGKSLTGCGTYGGYQRHRRAGEPTCRRCREARNEYVRAWRRSKETA